MIVIESTISDNATGQGAGAGIRNASGTVMVINSTIADNRAGQDVAGGILNAAGVAIVTNATFTGNRSGIQTGETRGGTIVNVEGTVTLTNVTIARNGALPGGTLAGQDGGGLLNLRGRITLHNSILAHNLAGEGPDCSGVITSLGYNIVGDLSGCTLVRGPNDIVGDPGLDEFLDSDTPGRGHIPLRPGSRAIDRALFATCTVLDQLGAPRNDGDGNGVIQCDRGAVEFQR